MGNVFQAEWWEKHPSVGVHWFIVAKEMERLGKCIINLGNPPCQLQIMTNKPNAYSMHAKTCEENIHATRYLQAKLVVVTDPDVLLHFPILPLPSFSKHPSMPHSPRVLQENSRCLRV